MAQVHRVRQLLEDVGVTCMPDNRERALDPVDAFELPVSHLSCLLLDVFVRVRDGVCARIEHPLVDVFLPSRLDRFELLLADRFDMDFAAEGSGSGTVETAFALQVVETAGGGGRNQQGLHVSCVGEATLLASVDATFVLEKVDSVTAKLVVVVELLVLCADGFLDLLFVLVLHTSEDEHEDAGLHDAKGLAQQLVAKGKVMLAMKL